MLLVQSSERRTAIIQTKPFSPYIGICHIPFFFFFLFLEGSVTLSLIFDVFSELCVNTIHSLITTRKCLASTFWQVPFCWEAFWSKPKMHHNHG